MKIDRVLPVNLRENIPLHTVAYFRYGTFHSLCNARHLRELERAWEQDKPKEWAQKMIGLLKEINKATNDAGC